MATWSILCGHCGEASAATVVYGWPAGNNIYAQQESAKKVTLWLECPSCKGGSVKTPDGAVYPSAAAGRRVAGLSTDVDRAWQEGRSAHAVAAYTAAEMMFRKILMHIAVEQAGASQGQNFTQYVDALDTAGYIAPGMKPVVDQVRKRGNAANHELPASTEQESLATMAITEHLLAAMYELPSLATAPPPPSSPPPTP